jgi:hypothetical protein
MLGWKASGGYTLTAVGLHFASTNSSFHHTTLPTHLPVQDVAKGKSMPAWNQIQCKAWLLRRGLQKGNEHEVKKTVAINDMNATRAKPGLQRRFSVDGSNQSGRPKAFELQKNVDGEMVPV